MLVVIDHHEARVFKSELKGTRPDTITPYDPHGYGKHVHNRHDPAKGQQHPVPRSYYEAVAKTLEGAGSILLFGVGAGGGSAMAELSADLEKHHQDLHQRIVGSLIIDETHMTGNQILARAREFYDEPIHDHHFRT